MSTSASTGRAGAALAPTPRTPLGFTPSAMSTNSAWMRAGLRIFTGSSSNTAEGESAASASAEMRFRRYESMNPSVNRSALRDSPPCAVRTES